MKRSGIIQAYLWLYRYAQRLTGDIGVRNYAIDKLAQWTRGESLEETLNGSPSTNRRRFF